MCACVCVRMCVCVPQTCSSLLVHKVAQDRALRGGVGGLPGHDDVVPVCVMDPDVHRSPGSSNDRGGAVWKCSDRTREERSFSALVKARDIGSLDFKGTNDSFNFI